MHFPSVLSLSLPWPGALLFLIWKLEEPPKWAPVHSPHLRENKLPRQISVCLLYSTWNLSCPCIAYRKMSKFLSRVYKAFMVGFVLNLHSLFLQIPTKFQPRWMIWRGPNPTSPHVFAHAILLIHLPTQISPCILKTMLSVCVLWPLRSPPASSSSCP